MSIVDLYLCCCNCSQNDYPFCDFLSLVLCCPCIVVSSMLNSDPDKDNCCINCEETTDENGRNISINCCCCNYYRVDIKSHIYQSKIDCLKFICCSISNNQDIHVNTMSCCCIGYSKIMTENSHKTTIQCCNSSTSLS